MHWYLFEKAQDVIWCNVCLRASPSSRFAYLTYNHSIVTSIFCRHLDLRTLTVTADWFRMQWLLKDIVTIHIGQLRKSIHQVTLCPALGMPVLDVNRGEMITLQVGLFWSSSTTRHFKRYHIPVKSTRLHFAHCTTTTSGMPPRGNKNLCLPGHNSSLPRWPQPFKLPIFGHRYAIACGPNGRFAWSHLTWSFVMQILMEMSSKFAMNPPSCKCLKSTDLSGVSSNIISHSHRHWFRAHHSPLFSDWLATKFARVSFCREKFGIETNRCWKNFVEWQGAKPRTLLYW